MKTQAIILAVLALAIGGSVQAQTNVYSVNVTPGPRVTMALSNQFPFMDVTGKWKADFEATVGPLKYTYDLKQDGGKVTGKATRASDTETNQTDLTDGKLDGDAISFTEALKIGDQDISITYKGKVAGDEMKLTRSVGDFGSTDLVAKREKPAMVTGTWNAEFDNQLGHIKYTYDLKQDGDKVTGSAFRMTDTDTNKTELKDGKLAGDTVSFVEALKVQDQDISINYTGKVAGDEIKFTRVVGEFATNEITAKRANTK